jgi:DNA processing protein
LPDANSHGYDADVIQVFWQRPDSKNMYSQASEKSMTAEELLGQLNEVEQKFAPKQLFIVGHTEILQEGARVSIVGSREASEIGLRRAKKLARLVCEHGGVVVSGLAKGIDTAAHTAAIEAGGKTIAVIGTPQSQRYPKENSALQTRIQRDFLCVSQFSEGYPVQPQNFPIRNRTMALISDATVIVEAGQTSGSISQGWEALRLGRGLFIAKALTENPKLTWPEEMMEYGARVLADESIEDFFEFLPSRSRAFAFDEFSV